MVSEGWPLPKWQNSRREPDALQCLANMGRVANEAFSIEGIRAHIQLDARNGYRSGLCA
jgi:hypothetical protein